MDSTIAARTNTPINAEPLRRLVSRVSTCGALLASALEVAAEMRDASAVHQGRLARAWARSLKA